MRVEKKIEENGVNVTHRIENYINQKLLENSIENIFVFAYFDKIKHVALMIVLLALSLTIGVLLYFDVIKSIFFYILGGLFFIGFILRVIFFKKIIENDKIRILKEYNEINEIEKLVKNKKCSWNFLVEKTEFKNNTIAGKLDVFLSNELKQKNTKYWKKEFSIDKIFQIIIEGKFFELNLLKFIHSFNIIKSLAKRDLLKDANNLMPSIGIYYDIYDGKYYIVMEKNLIPDGYEEIFNSICDKIETSRIFEMHVTIKDSDFAKEMADKYRRKDEIENIENYILMVPNLIREKDLKQMLSEKENIQLKQVRKKI